MCRDKGQFIADTLENITDPIVALIEATAAIYDDNNSCAGMKAVMRGEIEPHVVALRRVQHALIESIADHYPHHLPLAEEANKKIVNVVEDSLLDSIRNLRRN